MCINTLSGDREIRLFKAIAAMGSDMQLAASAPDLLEACEEALKQLEAKDCPPIPDGAMVRGRLYAAITKATKGQEGKDENKELAR